MDTIGIDIEIGTIEDETCISTSFTLSAKNTEHMYLENTMKTLVFDILICWNGLAQAANKYYNFHVTHAWCVMDGKCNLQCPKLKLHNWIYRNVSFPLLRLRYANHVYLTFRTRFLLISINMVYGNEAHFRYDTKSRDTAPRITLFSRFVSCGKF